MQALRYPVFTGIDDLRPRLLPLLHLGLPVRVGGLVVNQGDLLHGDANGVTSIPLEIAAEVADAADEFCDAEKIIMGYARSSGPKTCEGLAQVRKEFNAALERLRRRIRA